MGFRCTGNAFTFLVDGKPAPTWRFGHSRECLASNLCACVHVFCLRKASFDIEILALWGVSCFRCTGNTFTFLPICVHAFTFFVYGKPALTSRFWHFGERLVSNLLACVHVFGLRKAS